MLCAHEVMLPLMRNSAYCFFLYYMLLTVLWFVYLKYLVFLFYQFISIFIPLSASNANACRATGRGLQPKGVRIKEVADFTVFTKGAGTGDLKVSVKGPGKSVPDCAHLSIRFGTKMQPELITHVFRWSRGTCQGT